MQKKPIWRNYNNMCNKNAYWIQLESNNLGEPTKYKCIKCNQNLDIIKHVNYIEQRNCSIKTTLPLIKKKKNKKTIWRNYTMKTIKKLYLLTKYTKNQEEKLKNYKIKYNIVEVTTIEE